MEKIDELLDRVKSLTPASQATPRLLAALADSGSDCSRVVDLVSFDPGLTAALMRTCNSALFSWSTPANDVSEAVRRLGFKTVYQIVAAVSVAPCLGSGAGAGERWRHSVKTAVAAQFVAEDIGIDSSMLFTAGLLHDVGKVVMEALFDKDYACLATGTPATGTLIEKEEIRFGVNHAEVGARLLERWQFTPLFVASVRFHHDPSACGDAERFAACLNLADALAHSLDKDQTGQAIEWPEPSTALRILGTSNDEWARYRERFKEYVDLVEAICGLRN